MGGGGWAFYHCAPSGCTFLCIHHCLPQVFVDWCLCCQRKYLHGLTLHSYNSSTHTAAVTMPQIMYFWLCLLQPLTATPDQYCDQFYKQDCWSVINLIRQDCWSVTNLILQTSYPATQGPPPPHTHTSS